jgi:hypothetical protein
MTRSWRPTDDPITSPAGGRWMWPRWIRRRGPVRVEAGAARQKQPGCARQPACSGRQPAPAAVTEDWPWLPTGRLVVLVEGETNRTHQHPTPACSEPFASSAVGRRRPRRPVAGGSAVWPSPVHQHARGLLHRGPPSPVLVGPGRCSWSDRAVDSSSAKPRWVISKTASASTRNSDAAWAMCSSSPEVRWVLSTSRSMA